MQKVNIWQDGIIPGWLRGVGRLCLLTCAIIRTELDKEASWKEPSCDHSTVIRTREELGLSGRDLLKLPTKAYGRIVSPWLEAKYLRDTKGFSWKQIADLVWMITILSWWKRSEWCHLCTGSFSPCSSLHWCSPLTVSSLLSSSHGAVYLPPPHPWSHRTWWPPALFVLREVWERWLRKDGYGKSVPLEIQFPGNSY